MAKLKQLESFVSVVARGSLTAAALAEGVAPAIMGRRLDALEEQLGVKLLVRTTRRIALTHEGSAFQEDCQRLLADLANAEASVSAGGVKASGHLRITAPADGLQLRPVFGRPLQVFWHLHEPMLPAFDAHVVVGIGALQVVAVSFPHLFATGGLAPVRMNDGSQSKVPLMPFTLGGRRPGVRLQPPLLGEHSRELLQELGYGEDAIQAFQSAQVNL